MKIQKFHFSHGLMQSIYVLHLKKELALTVRRQLGITQKTAWFLLDRGREMLKTQVPIMLREEVEIDEFYSVVLKK